MTLLALSHDHLREIHLTATFEKLDSSLVFPGGFETGEGPEISPFAGLGVLLSRVETVLAGC
jgi:hypothetical protein